mmetsp:Transcript_81002/g.203902  ORF Transcript_81002/g.203902 Transcript_81002/m.203902 type:complete len:209 (-) Transcript_81002:560-1186(-)
MPLHWLPESFTCCWHCGLPCTLPSLRSPLALVCSLNSCAYLMRHKRSLSRQQPLASSTRRRASERCCAFQSCINHRHRLPAVVQLALQVVLLGAVVQALVQLEPHGAQQVVLQAVLARAMVPAQVQAALPTVLVGVMAPAQVQVLLLEAVEELLQLGMVAAPHSTELLASISMKAAGQAVSQAVQAPQGLRPLTAAEAQRTRGQQQGI